MASNYKRILAAIDGAEDTFPVLDRAIELAKDTDAYLDILNVLEVNQFNYNYGSSINSDSVIKLTDDTKTILETLKKQAIDAGVKDVKIHMRFGSPKKIIGTEFPEDHNNDLIVLGATGLSAVERLMVGSVTTYVTGAAKSDVLIVK